MEQPKIKVYAKAQNRTALGIVNAYLLIHPNATLSDLHQAFPDSLNPDSGVKQNFANMAEIANAQSENWDGFFSKDDEVLHLADGTNVALVKMWTKPSLERLVEKAKEYGIVTAPLESAEKPVIKKSGFELEYLNGFVPTQPKKGSSLWLWILLALAVVGGVASYFLM